MKHLIMGTAGHVDHGKTSLIKALTNTDCDTHSEEKRRGITINLGFTYLNLPDGESVGIIDVPGHKDFISTMVSGACGIDFVLLVIAADSGIMPQTIEHVNIISALGISKGLVALTRTDLVDTELEEMAKAEVEDFLKNSSLSDFPVIGVSSLTGRGLDELVRTIESVAAGVEERDSRGLFRMYIDRIFTVKGFGSVVTGSVISGVLESGSDVFLLPGTGQKLRVRSIERHGKAVDRVVAGDRAAINLIGLKNDEFERGMIIASKELPATSMLDASVKLFADSPELPLWTKVSVVTGTFESHARMHLLDADTLAPGTEAMVQIHLQKPAALVSRDRFIFRNSSGDLTLGGGVVLDHAPLHHKRRTGRLLAELKQLAGSNSGEEGLAESIRMELKREFRPFMADELSERLHVSIDEINRADGRWKKYIADDGIVLTDTNYVSRYAEKAISILQDYHKNNSLLGSGLATKDIAGKLELSGSKAGKIFLEGLLADMKDKQQLDFFKNTWIIQGHKPVISKQEAEEISWLENEIFQYDLEVPLVTEIEGRALSRKIQKHKLKTYLNYLAGEGKIRFLRSDFIHAAIAERFRVPLLKKLASSSDGIGIPEFKEMIGGTRRFRALLTDLFEAEKIITVKHGSETETRIMITSAGKKIVG